jgi:hypothetical protein
MGIPPQVKAAFYGPYCGLLVPVARSKTCYIIKPTGANNPSQNAGTEHWKQTLAITTSSLMYSSGLPA